MDRKKIVKIHKYGGKKNTVYSCILYLGFFLFFFFLAYNVPYCHDEWQWGLPERVELMKNGFKDYNGRYLGNILALIITRNIWLKAFIISIFSLWLFYIINQNILKKDEKKAPFVFQFFCAFLLLSLPQTLFCQSYGWPAAFVNFVPPVILFLIYYNLTEQTYWSTNPRYSFLMTTAVLPLGFATQLFSEHITIFAAAYAGWMIILCLVRYRRIYIVYLNYLLGTIAGAFVMFSNGAYHNAATGADSYKHIQFSIKTLVEQFILKLWDDLLLNNWILNIMLASAVLYFVWKNEKKRLVSAILGIILCGYCTYSVFHRINPAWEFSGNEMVNGGIEMILSLMFVLSISLGIWRCLNNNQRYSILVLYICSICVVLPLLAANPIGSRCFFVSYVFQAIVFLKLIREILKHKKNLFLPGICILTIVLSICTIYLRMFNIVGKTDRYRSQLITAGIENGQKEITLPILPYSDYFWTTVPANEIWEKSFKEFYHIPQDITLKFQ